MVSYVEHFQMRVLQDALASAHAGQLIRRAEQFEAARPRPGDFHGRATRSDLSRRWRELTEIAEALRAKAAIVSDSPVSLHVVDELREVA